ncbi:type II secretion system protein F (GspF) [Pseudomonas frederiksbergensis]|jgi:tight adherence protein C|uniref:Type II secretion system protein F (GspF) n=1 Tax=Pseudomonas frederiksbergensis TaxID=104087 RepID=A0A1H4TU59_9PSED|nr:MULTISPECIES: type II secretion system F family protein [Pseudomonas]PMU08953.1 type II secretion system F family protein [Pseudomonas sp. FW305-20]PMU17345.1 type II secretion system F family protein [Pseudomonas sp. FW305-122]PMU37319.1 type II secretion system F family protein [Pseudomonas sp. FW305-47B]PMX59976.1 type II secretion system F family protein [Pseudomonas sp. FW305-33]PMX68161.1 type II secretion system F family protein [Pseudomonas sp. FW305-60]
MKVPLLICALLLLGATLLLLSGLLEHRRRARQVAQRLDGKLASDNRVNQWLELLGSSRIGQRSVNLDNETQALLNRLGWRSARRRSLFAAFQVGAPVLALALALLIQGVFFPHADNQWMAPVLATCIGYLLPKRLLAAAAQRRQKQLALEISTFIPLLRILFESGMAVEQSLRVLSNEGKQLLPALTHELRLVLARVDSGLELGEELHKVTQLLAVDEFTDTCVILEQLIHQGGGAMKSLLTLKQLLDDRRLTRLQEYISKLSAKMSIVMMLFLFPALLIVLAGPGFTALSRAFGS